MEWASKGKAFKEGLLYVYLFAAFCFLFFRFTAALFFTMMRCWGLMFSRDNIKPKFLVTS